MYYEPTVLFYPAMKSAVNGPISHTVAINWKLRVQERRCIQWHQAREENECWPHTVPVAFGGPTQVLGRQCGRNEGQLWMGGTKGILCLHCLGIVLLPQSGRRARATHLTLHQKKSVSLVVFCTWKLKNNRQLRPCWKH